MADAYAYIISNNKIEPIFTKIRTAAKPTRFSASDTLPSWGFTASNDRAMVAVLKQLGFLTEAGAPTEHYDRLRDANDWKYVLAERMRDMYADLYAIDTAIHAAPEDEVKGAMARVTGKDDETVKRYYSTFKTLASLAKFEPKPTKDVKATEREAVVTTPRPLAADKLESTHSERPKHRPVEYHYNIQIHLPATTDVAVYGAIFKTLKENLGI